MSGLAWLVASVIAVAVLMALSSGLNDDFPGCLIFGAALSALVVVLLHFAPVLAIILVVLALILGALGAP